MCNATGVAVSAATTTLGPYSHKQRLLEAAVFKANTPKVKIRRAASSGRDCISTHFKSNNRISPFVLRKLATASHLTCLRQPHFRHEITAGWKPRPKERLPKKKLQNDKAACGQVSAVSRPQSSFSPKRFRQTRRSASPRPSCSAPSCRGRAAKDTSTPGSQLSHRGDSPNVPHRQCRGRSTRAVTRQTGGPKTPPRRDIVLDLGNEGENVTTNSKPKLCESSGAVTDNHTLSQPHSQITQWP